MQLIGIIEEDFINYKKISMTLEFPYCSFKCNKEYGSNICQNYQLNEYTINDYNIEHIVSKYINNNISESIVMQGLEPLDSFEDVIEFIRYFRYVCNDDIVIYTGYEENEIKDKLLILKQFKNIIVKIGRYIPNEHSHFDRVLGINLASSNQYAINLEDYRI